MLGLGAVAVVVRAFTVQVVQHEAWARRAEARDIRERDVAPRRGGIFDRDMTPLAATYEAYHVEVAVNELEDVAAARRLIQESLGVSVAQVARQFRGPYPYFDGPFDAMQVQPLRGIKGIHFQPLLGREHPMGDLARPLAFQAGLQLEDGGRLAAQGTLVPDTGVLQADVRIAQFSLVPFARIV